VSLSHHAVGCLLVAVTMKVSRWRDFLKRGWFPFVPRHAVAFLRIDLHDCDAEIPSFDILLHKVGMSICTGCLV